MASTYYLPNRNRLEYNYALYSQWLITKWLCQWSVLMRVKKKCVDNIYKYFENLKN